MDSTVEVDVGSKDVILYYVTGSRTLKIKTRREMIPFESLDHEYDPFVSRRETPRSSRGDARNQMGFEGRGCEIVAGVRMIVEAF